MKIRRFNESKMDVVNSKDMKNWDPKQFYKQAKTGSKNIDENLGKKVELLLEKYDLVAKIGGKSTYRKNYINTQDLCFPDETNLNEHRICLYSMISFEDWCDNNGYDIDDMSEDEIDDLEEKYSKELPVDDYEDNYEFSVFLPENVNDVVYAGLFDASMYLKFLNNSVTDAIKGMLEYHTVYNEQSDELKDALDIKNISITNKNIEILPRISYRFYKDSKFFYDIYNGLGKDYLQLFRDWLNLIGEKPNF